MGGSLYIYLINPNERKHTKPTNVYVPFHTRKFKEISLIKHLVRPKPNLLLHKLNNNSCF